jgi:nucleoside-diphosphate-sugar epimerase
MQPITLVAGATGNLGGRIASALLARGAAVHALVRAGSDRAKVDALASRGVKVITAELTDPDELTAACAGATCVVSALQGLRDVIVDAQKQLIDAAVAAGVPRFIPSDFSTDFTGLPVGENRNFDLRRELHTYLESAPIAATSIYNGAFPETLTYNVPLLDLKARRVGYWEDPDWRNDFTTMNDTAAFTAAAALDPTTPRALRIASFQISPRELAAVALEVTGSPFDLVRLGSRAELRAQIHRMRAAQPDGEDEVFPVWQRMQYTLGMFSAQHGALDNGRYRGLTWTPARDIVALTARRA